MSDEHRHHDDQRAPHSDAPRSGAVDEITTAWQAAKDAFATSQRRYQELVEHSLGLICTHDLTGRLGSINPAAARSLGYEPDHGVGRNLVEFLAPETRHLFDEYLQRIRDSGQDSGLMRVIARDGRERVWMYRNTLFEEPGRPPYVLGHAIDISERVAAERALRENEQALRRAHDELERRVKERTIALEHANDTLVFLSSVSEGLSPVLRLEQLLDVMRTLPVPFAADWTMVHVLADDGSIRSEPGIHIDPERTARLHGLAAAASGPLHAESLVGQAIDTGRLVIVTDTTDDLTTPFVGLAAMRQPAGNAGLAVLPLVTHGRPKAALSLGTADGARFTGSGRIVVEDLARRSRLALDRIEMYREAQDANRVKDEFLSTLSHELRTPLNAVYGWARILRMRNLDKNTAHAVAVIERNAEAQIRMIEDVLDVSRMITGKMTLAMESLDVRGVLRATLDSVRPALQAKRVRLDAHIAEDVPPVLGDANRLQQVFWNVLSNAVKFTGVDGLVTVSLRRASDWAEIQVADTGIGIRRDVLPFVFDRFRQGDASTTRMHGGLGLGLAIVRQVVELHGGSVKADSAGEDHGATFTIHLPIDRRNHAPQAPVSSDGVSSGTKPSSPLRGRTVLVVEDHEDTRELVASVLAAAGARVLTAGSTEEALNQIARDTPDVLLADLGLPREDGYALLLRIREMKVFEDRPLPAVALTAYARASDRERALAAGFLHYVVKPIDPVALVKVIESVVSYH